jgi:putative nucleotidyltransferase with HDIG domain
VVRTVLYVDDEAALCRAFERALRGPEMRVITTTSPPHAVELLDREPFDVVATDYRMPDINGIEILRAARRKAPQARRLLVSGRIEGEVPQEILDDADIDHVLIKPWSLDELRRVVRRAAEFAALTREKTQLTLTLASREQHAARERRQQEIALLVGALELRDPETARHSRAVARLARRLAEALGLGGEELQSIEEGALLHDVGKIGLADQLLRKPEPLSTGELQQLAQHPMVGARLLEGSDLLPGTAAIVREHHERVDGGGYPLGLRGQEITLAARIVAVADAYDAMRADVPYRQKRSHEETLVELVRNAGTQFDRLVVDALLKLDDN